MVNSIRHRRTSQERNQRGVRTFFNPTISRRYSTYDRMLRYNKLQTPLLSDTLISSPILTRGNKYTQVYCNDMDWIRFYPMQKKSEAHLTISELFRNEGVPPDFIVDGSKEQTKGGLKAKCRQADCHIRQIEPHSP